MIANSRIRPTGREITRSCYRLGWIEISLIAFVLALGFLSAGFPSSAKATMVSPLNKHPVFLPMIASGAAPHVDSLPVCELNAQETQIITFMREHPQQGRANVYCNPVLSRVARAKAEDMAKRRYFDHVDPDGHGPNHLVTAAGFRLPDYYPQTGSANNIESIGAGYLTPGEVWQAWLNSHYHAIHVLGTDGFYANQQQVGIGFYEDPNSQYKQYWVVISAPNEE